MLTRIRRNEGEASSLISPFGNMHRRIAASTSRKSPTSAAAALNNGNSAFPSRNCVRSHPAVSSSEPASSSSFASSATPIPPIFSSHISGSASPPNPNSFPPRNHSRASRISANCACNDSASRENSSASTALRPGTHVVRSRSNSRSLSNSNTSCALRLTLWRLCSGHLQVAILFFLVLDGHAFLIDAYRSPQFCSSSGAPSSVFEGGSFFTFFISCFFFSLFFSPDAPPPPPRFLVTTHYLLLPLTTRRSRRIKLLNHRNTQRVQRIGRFMALRSHVVAHERKHQPLPVRQIRI